MTLEELDNALTRLHLDLKNPVDIEIRNKILARHGKDLLDSKKFRCENCWIKENKGKCNPSCQMYNIPKDPVEASKKYISEPNNIYLFSFLCIYVIPVYEEITGNKNTMEKMAIDFKRLWNKKKSQSDSK